MIQETTDISFLMGDLVQFLSSLYVHRAKAKTQLIEVKTSFDLVLKQLSLEIYADKSWLIDNASILGLEGYQPALSSNDLRELAIGIAKQKHPFLASDYLVKETLEKYCIRLDEAILALELIHSYMQTAKILLIYKGTAIAYRYDSIVELVGASTLP